MQRPRPQLAPSRALQATMQLAAISLLLGGGALLRAQTQPLPAQPADQTAPQNQAPTSTPPTLDQVTPPEVPAAQQQATPGTVPVPKALPSRMPTVPGDIIDRVVAIVNGQPVLDSDVNEEHRFEAIQPYPNSAGTPATREREIERLINRDLILQQSKLETQLTISDADVDKEITNLRKTLPGCKNGDCTTSAGWANYLHSKGFDVAEFRTRWQERMEVLAFIQERFGAGTSVTEGQIREFYQNNMLPQYKKAGTPPAPFKSVEGRIRDILQQRQVSSLLRDWLQSLRAQGSITVLHPGEEAP